jgi:hypothetical protein
MQWMGHCHHIRGPSRAVRGLPAPHPATARCGAPAAASAIGRLTTLLQRTTDPALRRQILERADDKQLADLAVQGVVTAAPGPATALRSARWAASAFI